ncbi:MAG: flagellar biosynthesis protein FlhF [Bdellovibrionales bacterium]
MQVKKFEAKTMKEALDLVKIHLGPEAIILSAKDAHKGFGLMGDKSVEVTAAVTEEVLRKKKMAESKLREDLRDKFHQIPATRQKDFINRVHKRFERGEERELETIGSKRAVDSRPMAPLDRAALQGLRYIDIEDEPQPTGRERVRSAAERARRAAQAVTARPPAPQVVPRPVTQEPPPGRVVELESQVRELKSIVDRFQSMPQLSMNLHPGAELGLPFEMSSVYQKLTNQGVRPTLVERWLKQAMQSMEPDARKKPALVEAWMIRHLMDTVKVEKNPFQGRYHVFLGSTGQGKSTTLVKFASQLVLRERKTIAIVSMDTIKLGASDSLRIFAQILNVPFAVVRTPEEWRVAERKLKNVQCILVDAPGFNLKSMEEADWLRRMLPPTELDRRLHYVQSVLARQEECFDLASRYQIVGFHDTIFTRLDECSQHGLLLDFQDKFPVPIHSFGTGSKIPEDYEIATKEKIVELIFKWTRALQREDNP